MRIRLLLVAITACSVSLLAQEPVTPEEWRRAREAYQDDWEEAASMDLVAIPRLLAPALEKSWGPPVVRTAPDGSYWIQYSDPSQSFERVDIIGYAGAIPPLASAPDEFVDTMVEDQLATVERPQEFQVVNLRIPTPDGKKKLALRYFREYSGGGADGPLDSTDTIQLSINGLTGYYIVRVESVSKSTRKRLKALEVR